MPGEVQEVVMAVFSGTEVDRAVFDRALELTREQGARLVLANIRHQHQAERLAETLSSEAFLGPKAVEELKRSVKAQRDEVIKHALAALREAAARAGIAAEIREAKGALTESVRQLAAELDAKTVVIEERYVAAVADGYRVVGVR